MRLADKIAIITGAGSGIGRASSIRFAREGATVVVADINDSGGEETVAAIKSDGREALFIHTDVSKASEVENVIKATMEKFGKIDILFNNAGTPQKTMPFENLEESLWDHLYATNVKSIYLTVKNAIPVMEEAGKGVIINLASMAGVRPRPGSAAYAGTKAAVIHLTKALAIELAPKKIRVNGINPAAVDTPMLPKFKEDGMDLDTFYEGAKASMPLGRIATPDDVANAALYLASDEADIITGICINVDGGRGI
jgi:3-oxoacyl-[acyl-carrier protein] reductase